MSRILDFDVLRSCPRRAEADPELVVSRRESKVLEAFGCVELSKLALSDPLDVGSHAGDSLASPDLPAEAGELLDFADGEVFPPGVREGLDHDLDSKALRYQGQRIGLSPLINMSGHR